MGELICPLSRSRYKMNDSQSTPHHPTAKVSMPKLSAGTYKIVSLTESHTVCFPACSLQPGYPTRMALPCFHPACKAHLICCSGHSRKRPMVTRFFSSPLAHIPPPQCLAPTRSSLPLAPSGNSIGTSPIMKLRTHTRERYSPVPVCR